MWSHAGRPRGNLNIATIKHLLHGHGENSTSRHFTDRQIIHRVWCVARLSPNKADHHIHCLVWNNIEKVGLDTDTARGGGD